MRKFLLLILLFPSLCWAQSTTVSGTITDAGGQAWANGTYTFSFRVAPTNPTATYYWNGSPFPMSSQTIQGTLDTSGHFSVSVPSNTSITPSQSTWDFMVCPIALGNTDCYTQKQLSITGGTQDISFVHPPAISIDLAHPAYPFVVAYSSSEITTAPLGGIFYNWTTQHYYICEAISATGLNLNYGTCTNWVEICQFGDTTCGGTGAAAIYQHNGTLVAQQPKLNFIDTGSVTFTLANDGANSRVNVQATAAGGGTGCILPGINTAVLSEHPAGTCYDSLHWTWDDGTNKQVMLLGDGTNTATTARMAFLIGFNNAHTGSGLCCGDEVFLVGDSNVSVGSSSSLWVLGTDNSLNAVNGQYVIGADNSLRNNLSSNTFVIGNDNTLGNATASQNFGHTYVYGRDNTLNTVAGGTIEDMAIVGEANNVIVTDASHGVHGAHILGGANTITDVLNLSQEIEIVGEQNVVNGAVSTLQILGWGNTANNVSVAGVDNVNQTIVGSVNLVENTGNAAPSYQEVFGHLNHQHDCNNCIVVGANIEQSTSNRLDIGMSSAAELLITAGVFNVTAWPVSKIIAFTFCAVGCTLTGTPCTAGNNTADDCTNTINFSSLGTFVDTNYVATCGGVGPNDASHGAGQLGRVTLPGVIQKNTGSVIVETATQGATFVNWTEIDCTLVHR